MKRRTLYVGIALVLSIILLLATGCEERPQSRFHVGDIVCIRVDDGRGMIMNKANYFGDQDWRYWVRVQRTAQYTVVCMWEFELEPLEEGDR